MTQWRELSIEEAISRIRKRVRNGADPSSFIGAWLCTDGRIVVYYQSQGPRGRIRPGLRALVIDRSEESWVEDI